MEIIVFLAVSYVLLSLSLYKVFEKAGAEGWKGLVPGLNFVVWCQLIGRKGRHAAWLLFPIVNIFILAGMCVDLVRSFGKLKFSHSALAVIYAPAIFFYLGYSADEKYLGPILIAEKAYEDKIKTAREAGKTREVDKLERLNPYQKGIFREWGEAIIFAIFAAAFIRMFLIEAYVIPTSSMEGSLLVGDYLFVSKAHYGIRTPKTIAMIPLLHNRIPGLNRESYIDNLSIPYTRLPALESIDRNDPVVFNYPEGDSVYITPGRTFSVYDVRRNPSFLGQVPKRFPLVTRPLDKMDHYIKRCVALPGDSIRIINRQLYVNGEPAKNPTHIQFKYKVIFPGGSMNLSRFSEWGISPEDMRDKDPGDPNPAGHLIIAMSEEQKAKVQAMDPGIRIVPFDVTKLSMDPLNVFPYDRKNFPGWTVDNYGPLYIPKKGATVAISPQTLAPYRRIIEVYEGNQLEIKNGQIFINGAAANSYTFQMNYYWMMGDNRHNSEDARIWGYVPESHVVGKPLFIWFSTKEGNMGKGINWNRIFTGATKP